MRLWLSLLALALLGGFLGFFLWQSSPPTIEASIDLQKALSDSDGQFAVVRPGRVFTFPADYGEHPEFKTEWWYFTGNLLDESGLPYGYQLTFFRSGLAKSETSSEDASQWRPKDVMMAHFAVSDPERDQFFPFERFSRRALGLAGVEQSPEKLSVWLENWRLERKSDEPGQWTLQASETTNEGEMVRLSLELEESKPPLLQGDNGYSRKGPDAKDASYYVSHTRLESRGTLEIGSRSLHVRGLSWFDHEWSSAALAPGLVGWDWFSLQLDDGWDLMIYLLRYSDGRLEPASSGALVAPDGSKTNLTMEDFRVDVEAHHQSRRGVAYPSAWTINVPAHSLSLKVHPRLADQEMASGVPYWEGAVTVVGQRAGKESAGSGFVEMTGYK